jgi:RimJ/RimL family protein N-acetyltransferase
MIRIRPVQESDAAALFPLVYQSPLTDWLVWDGPASFEDYRAGIAAFAAQTRAGEKHIFTILEPETGSPIGNINIRPQPAEPTGIVGLWIGEPFQGKGYGAAAIAAIVRYAFDHLHLERIDAFVFTGNYPSRRAFEKNGFTLAETIPQATLKKGRKVDEWRMTLQRELP